MLYDVKSSVFSSHVHCDYGHAYLTWTIWSRKETATTAFPLDFFIFQFASFCLYSLPVIVVLVLKVLWKKIDQMWSDYRFLIFLKMSVQIKAKKFSENSWETPGFSRTILHGNLAGSPEYKQYRNQKQRQHKGHETTTRKELTKK